MGCSCKMIFPLKLEIPYNPSSGGDCRYSVVKKTAANDAPPPPQGEDAFILVHQDHPIFSSYALCYADRLTTNQPIKTIAPPNLICFCTPPEPIIVKV